MFSFSSPALHWNAAAFLLIPFLGRDQVAKRRCVSVSVSHIK